MINKSAAGKSSAVDSPPVDDPVLVKSPVEDPRAVDARWARRRRALQRYPNWFWDAVTFVVVALVTVSVVISIVYLVKPTYPQNLLLATSDAPEGSEFTAENVNKLLENFRTGQKLVVHPTHRKGTPNNPSPPKIRISPDVLASEQPVVSKARVCVPLSCSSDKSLKVEAMDSNTKSVTDRSVDPNGVFPGVTPIAIMNVRICCGPAINSDVTTPFKVQWATTNSKGPEMYWKAKYSTTGQCQLVSGNSQAPKVILPVQITGLCTVTTTPLKSCKDFP
eukprot:219233_1